MVKVKVCGITNLEDARLALKLGADALGFIFTDSPRQLAPSQAEEICRELPPYTTRVGVFVDADQAEVEETARLCRLDVLQLHGNETPSYCSGFGRKVVKSFRVKDSLERSDVEKYSVDAFLFDSWVRGVPGGTGHTFEWQLLERVKGLGPFVLSGGLTPDNVEEAIERVRPYAVDVCSGVEERPGQKSPQKLKDFMATVKRSERRLDSDEGGGQTVKFL